MSKRIRKLTSVLLALVMALSLMGHSDISITAKIYTKIDQDELKKEIQKLSVYFKK